MGDNKWRKSSRTGGGDKQNCVEARLRSGEFLVRDSKSGEASPILTASATDWRIFLNAVAKLPTPSLRSGREPDGSRPGCVAALKCPAMVAME